MAIRQQKISKFVLSAGLSSEGGAIDLTLADGTVVNLRDLSSGKFVAAVAVLQATRDAYYFWDEIAGHAWVASGEDAPGMV